MSETGCVRSEGQVTVQVKRYVDHVSSLEEVFGGLESRLANVLQPSVPPTEPTEGGKEKETLTPLASEIENTNCRLSDVIQCLAALTERIEV